MWGKLYGNFIIKGTYDYSFVISKRPDLKVEIDEYLTAAEKADLIV